MKLALKMRLSYIGTKSNALVSPTPPVASAGIKGSSGASIKGSTGGPIKGSN